MSTVKIPKTDAYGLVKCARFADAEPRGVKLSQAAKRRLVDQSGPVTCPTCETACGATFIEATPRGEGMILCHVDDEHGGRWQPGFTWLAQVGPRAV